MGRKSLIILALLFFVVAFYFGARDMMKKGEDGGADRGRNGSAAKDYPEDLSGKVYMTLKNKETGIFGVHYFDLDSGRLEEVYAPEGCYVIGGEVSPTKNEMAVSSNCETDEGSSFIQLLDLETKEAGKVAVGDLNGEDKKEAAFSADGKSIAFMLAGQKDSNEGADRDFLIENWNIFTSDMEGQEEFISVAVHPFFSPDGNKILALKKNGIFLFDLKTKEGRLVYASGTAFSASTQLDLSDRKDMLSVSDPNKKNITNFRIKSWESFEMEKVGEIKTEGVSVSWPKISPDNRYVIDEELFGDGKIELAAYDLKTEKRYVLSDLSAYEHDNLWINDWK